MACLDCYLLMRSQHLKTTRGLIRPEQSGCPDGCAKYIYGHTVYYAHTDTLALCPLSSGQLTPLVLNVQCTHTFAVGYALARVPGGWLYRSCNGRGGALGVEELKLLIGHAEQTPGARNAARLANIRRKFKIHLNHAHHCPALQDDLLTIATWRYTASDIVQEQG